MYSSVDGDVPCALLGRIKLGFTDLDDSPNSITGDNFVAITWNAGMEPGAVSDLVIQLDCGNHWDAVLLQEGPFSEHGAYTIIQGGHALFLAPSGEWKRSVGILLHRRWLDACAALEFSVLDICVAALDLDCGDIHLRLITSLLPHSNFSDDVYDSILSILELAIVGGRRSHRMNILGLDANAILGAQLEQDCNCIIGRHAMGTRFTRGDMLSAWMHGLRMAAATTMELLPLEECWSHELWSTHSKRHIDHVLLDE